MSGEGKTVCVTGGSGYIASWIVKLLLLRGYTVVCQSLCSRPQCAADNPYSPTYQISSEKANSLGIDYIPFKESIKETIESLKEKKLFSC